MLNENIRVGIIGVRGLNVIYSGFETLVRNLIKKSNKSYFYYVFSRTGYKETGSEGKNFKNLIIPIVAKKYLETPLYSLLSTLYSLFLPMNCVLYLSVANTPFSWLQKLKKRKIIVNVDGIDWKRSRWSIFGKAYLRMCEQITVAFSDIIVADSKNVYDYYEKTYKLKKISLIEYGAEVTLQKTSAILRKYKLTKGKYFLYVGRLTPENCVEDIISAFMKINTEYKCVIVGDSFFEEEYKKRLLSMTKSDRIVFTGILRGKEYEEMGSSAFCYVETKSVGGIHPSLLEAMYFGNCIIAKALPEHKEALGNSGLYYKNVKELVARMKFVIKNKNKANELGRKAKILAEKNFSWLDVVRKYENLF